MKANKIIKAIVFVLIFVIGFSAVQTVLEVGAEKDSKRIADFFDERESSHNAVFLGSSATYAFWSAPLAFAEHGITVYPFSSSDQPLFATKYIIEDAIKTQPDALYIINISSIKETEEKHMHKLLVDYPTTVNKLLMTDYLCDFFGLSFSESMEYYFPIIRFHGRWNELEKSDFSFEKDEYKHGNLYDAFLTETCDPRDFEYDYELRTELSEKVTKGLNDLMDYCEEKDVKVLFLISPQATIPERIAMQNTMIEMLEARGFNVLDLRRHVEDIGLDFNSDYYNNNHTNIHGSIKITDYISRYLIDNYGFEDKRGNEEYSDWTVASSKYYEEIAEYLRPEDYERLSFVK